MATFVNNQIHVNRPSHLTYNNSRITSSETQRLQHQFMLRSSFLESLPNSLVSTTRQHNTDVKNYEISDELIYTNEKLQKLHLRQIIDNCDQSFDRVQHSWFSPMIKRSPEQFFNKFNTSFSSVHCAPPISNDAHSNISPVSKLPHSLSATTPVQKQIAPTSLRLLPPSSLPLPSSPMLSSQSSSSHSRSIFSHHFCSRNYIHNFNRDRKKFKCPQCRYITDRKNNLMRHIITMHKESGKILECCGITFNSKSALREHNTVFHSGGYRCQICSRNFCRKALLRRHLTVHSGQKDYYCELCGYATSHKSNLERHQKVHIKRNNRVFRLTSSKDKVQNETESSVDGERVSEFSDTSSTFNIQETYYSNQEFFQSHLFPMLIEPNAAPLRFFNLQQDLMLGKNLVTMNNHHGSNHISLASNLLSKATGDEHCDDVQSYNKHVLKSNDKHQKICDIADDDFNEEINLGANENENQYDLGSGNFKTEYCLVTKHPFSCETIKTSRLVFKNRRKTFRTAGVFKSRLRATYAELLDHNSHCISHEPQTEDKLSDNNDAVTVAEESVHESNLTPYHIRLESPYREAYSNQAEEKLSSSTLTYQLTQTDSKTNCSDNSSDICKSIDEFGINFRNGKFNDKHLSDFNDDNNNNEHECHFKENMTSEVKVNHDEIPSNKKGMMDEIHKASNNIENLHSRTGGIKMIVPIDTSVGDTKKLFSPQYFIEAESTHFGLSQNFEQAIKSRNESCKMFSPKYSCVYCTQVFDTQTLLTIHEKFCGDAKQTEEHTSSDHKWTNISVVIAVRKKYIKLNSYND